MMKKLLIGILMIASVLFLAKDIIVKNLVEKGVEITTGLGLNIQNLNIGLVSNIIEVKNLRLFNPKEFPDKVMVDIPYIYIEYYPQAIMKGNIHLKEMRINLKEFRIIRNAKSILNLNSLKVVKDQKEGKDAKNGLKDKIPPLHIDDLHLKIGKLVYKDYSKNQLPIIKEFDLNTNERYKDITDLDSIVSLVVIKSLKNPTIAKFVDFDITILQGTLSGMFLSTQKIAGETKLRTEQAFKKTGEAIQKTTEEIEKVFTVPFKSKQEERTEK